MTDFAVVGAGPVGLFVACLLTAAGREVVVLEQDDGARQSGAAGHSGAAGPHQPYASRGGEQGTGRSRAIGIHPPALEALATVGVAAELIDLGVPIHSARLMCGADHLGSLSLRECPEPYPFVLSLPQHATEDVLFRALERQRPRSVSFGARVVAVRQRPASMELVLADGSVLQTGFVIGCDGRSSRVRESLAVPVIGGALDHHYVMADLPDDTSLGYEAAISLSRQGVVESFPLPKRRRRWVARVPRRHDQATASAVASLVERRTGYTIDPGGATATAFTAERRVAGSFTGERWALAGDAAHVISPIGGQGMNLGLIGALDLVRALTATRAERLLAAYDRRQRARAYAAARRASQNMFLGSERLPEAFLRAALRTVLIPALSPRFARYYTMRGLR